ncbi:GerAB/ArcD/ProY family transporter [Sporolactobacillus putidus]|uniref:Germination protein GerB n=1 Tax=Sporolactobacillus putidus TaxID=492735 RepID=A0A917RYL5_9BACL|nr:GerAB/ArcD/ProY family transporter [Sporolactobacillus putidus]GGL42581.1 germination protein GerB [Sporolactobacillus putidus]
MKQFRINETHQVSPVYALFIIKGMQVGVSVFSFQRIVSRDSEQDAWIPVMVMGLSTLVIMWIMLRLLKNEQAYGMPDLFAMHRRFFGPWIGNLFSAVIIAYEFCIVIIFMRAYIELLQMWVFPRLPVLSFTAIFCLIVWYIVMGGFRTITGTFLLSFIYLLPLFLVNSFSVTEAHFNNLLPLFDHSPAELARSFIKLSPCYLGFESLLFFYPFLKRPQQAEKWCYYGLLTSLSVYVTTTVLGTVYFSQGELQTLIWPLLDFWKSIHFPLFDRFEYIGIVYWLTVLIPNISMGVWIVSRGIKQSAPVIKQKYALVPVLLLLILICVVMKERSQIDWLNTTVSRVGLCIIYIYIPFLLFWQWILKKKEGMTHEKELSHHHDADAAQRLHRR